MHAEGAHTVLDASSSVQVSKAFSLKIGLKRCAKLREYINPLIIHRLAKDCTDGRQLIAAVHI